MSSTVTINGVSYTIPSVGEENWGQNVTNYLVAIAAGLLQKAGGSFTLTAETDFGATYGLKSAYYKSRGASISTAGILRLTNTESVGWRNAADAANLELKPKAATDGILTYGGLDLVDVSSSQSISGKTFTSSTFTGTLSGFTASRALVSDGSGNLVVSAVTSTELAKLSGVGSSVLGKDDAGTLTGKTIDAGSNTITNLANANISGSAAIAYSKLNLATSIVNADISASAAIAYSKLNLSTSIVNADVSSSAAIAYSKLNLSGSILNADINASAAIALSKLAALTVSRALVSDGSGVVSVSAVTSTEVGYLSGVTSSLLGKDQSGTLTGKTLTSPAINGANFNFGTSSNTNRLILPSDTSTNLDALTKTAGLIAYDTSQAKPVFANGTSWVTIGSGSGGGGTNYITNGDAEENTTGWAAYADAASSSIADATGGSPTVTWTRSTSSPGRGNASFLLTKDAANRQGEGASFAFNCDVADQGKMLQVAFDYAIASGTYADGDLYLWIYDVTNSTIIQPAGYKIYNAATGLWIHQVATFQSASNSTSYRLAIHCASTSASAYTVKFDGPVSVGPQITSQGSPITDWTSYTPTTNMTNATVTGVWRRVGDSMEADIAAKFTGTPGAATFLFSLPSGYSFDTTRLSNYLNGLPSTSIGVAIARDSGTQTYIGSVIPYGSSTTQVLVEAPGTGGTSEWTNANPFSWGTNDTLGLRFTLPIVGWSASCQMSADTGDSRVVSFVGFKNGSTQAVTANTTDITATSEKDSHSAWSGSLFTVPVPGDYIVSASQANNAAAAAGFRIYVDGSLYRRVFYNDSAGDLASGSTIVWGLKAGQTISWRCDSTITLGGFGVIAISRISGPNAIAASETVTGRYYSSSTGLSGSLATINYSIKDWDSHNCYSSGTVTIPVSGKYQINASIKPAATFTLNNNTVIEIQKNGTVVSRETIYAAAAVTDLNGAISDIVNCNAGDTIRIQVSCSGTGPSIASSNYENYFSWAKVGN